MKKLISYDAGPLHKEIMWRNRARYETDSVRARKSTPSCAAQIFANQKLKYNKLELMLAANIRPGDIVGVLTYNDNRLPGCRRDIINDLAYFRRKLTAAHSAQGKELRMIWCIEGTHEDGVHFGPRYHIHFVMPRIEGDEELIKSSWFKGIVLLTRFQIDARRWARGLHIKEKNLHPQADGSLLGYEPLARYMCKEGTEENSVRTWSYTMKTCFKPVFDRRDVPDDYRIRAPQSCITLSNAHESSTGYEAIKYISLAELGG